MEPIFIRCDDRIFKTRRRTISEIFGDISDDQTEIRLDIDPDDFLPILEDLRENFELLSTSTEFVNKIKEITISDVNLDVGGKIFTTSKKTLCKSDFFKASFTNWNQSITFIDRDPTKFSQLINYLRGTNDDPGPYADFYLVPKPVQTIEDISNLDNTWIIRDQPYHVKDSSNRITLETLYKKEKTTIKLSQIEESATGVKFQFDLRNSDQYVDNFKFVSNRGLKSICIAISEQYIFCDTSENSHLFENIKSLPPLLNPPYQSLIMSVELTGPGFVQFIYDNHQFNSVNERMNPPVPKSEFTSIFYYGQTDILLPSRPPFMRNTMTIIIRKNPDIESLILSSMHSSSNQLSEIRHIDSLSHAEYLKQHPEAHPDFYYIEISENPFSSVGLYYRFENIVLNYKTDVWMLNVNKICNEKGVLYPFFKLS